MLTLQKFIPYDEILYLCTIEANCDKKVQLAGVIGQVMVCVGVTHVSSNSDLVNH